MTESPDEYGDILRRVLRAQADSVVPSAEGLEIIRTRVDQRGLRGIFWWRAAASAFGAVLVAATVVMAVPGLREEIGSDPQPIVPVQFDTSPPDESSTRRPTPGIHPPSGGAQVPLPNQTITTTPFAAPTPTPSTSQGSECATPVPTAADSEAAGPPPCPSASATQSQPDQTTRPRPTPVATPTPSKTTTKPTTRPTPKPTRTPTTDPTPDPCQGCSPTPTPTDTAGPTATPQSSTEAETLNSTAP